MPSKEIIQRGALIVIEGIDKSGKSTQCDLLAKSLQNRGHSTKLMKFPERTTAIGKMCDAYLTNKCELDDHAIHLIFSANRWEASQTMKKDLLDGVTLIVDRYAYSGVAYSAAKPGMDIEWCKKPDSGLPKPDLVMFLNLTEEETQKRSGYGDERYEKNDFQKAVSAVFQKLSSDYWKTVDAGGSIKDVNKELTEIAVKTIETVKDSEIKKLWMNKDISTTVY